MTPVTVTGRTVQNYPPDIAAVHPFTELLLHWIEGMGSVPGCMLDVHPGSRR